MGLVLYPECIYILLYIHLDIGISVLQYGPQPYNFLFALRNAMRYQNHICICIYSYQWQSDIIKPLLVMHSSGNILAVNIALDVIVVYSLRSVRCAVVSAVL